MQKKIVIFTIYLFIFCLISPHAGFAENSALSALEANKAKKFVLDNGLTIIIKEDRSTPVIAIEALVSTGAAAEGEYAGSGITHYLEHMLFKGTKKRKVGQIEKEVKSFGGSINGFTSHDYTGYRIIALKDHLRDSLDIVKDILFNSSLDPREINREKDVILKEIRLNRDEPSRYLTRLLWSSAYRKHPYRHPVIGHENLFKKITREDMLKYYKRMYVPNNIVLGIVGDFEINSAYLAAHGVFSGVERGAPVDITLTNEPLQLSERKIEEKDDVGLAYFGIAFPGISLFSGDLYALDVLAITLGGGSSSRLNRVLYREKELVYSVGCWNYTPKDRGLFIVSGVADPAKIHGAMDEIKKQVDKIKDEGITPGELNKAKNAVLASYIAGRETVSGQASDLASSERLTGDFNFFKHYVDGINSVGINSIKRAASEYLLDNRRSTVVLMPESYQAPAEEGGAQPANSAGNIQKHVLPNGLTVLLKEDGSLPLISVKALFMGGIRTENESNNGLCNLMARLLTKGTDTMSEDEISEFVESMGGSIGYISGKNSFGLELNFMSRDTEAALNLLRDVLTKPAFDPKILEREKNSVLAAIKSEEDHIYQFAMKLVRENLFTGHPYRMRVAGNLNSVAKITRDDVAAYYNTWCRPNNMVLAVYGDISADDVLNTVKTNLADFDKADLPDISNKPEPALISKKEVVKPLDKKQSIIMIAFKGVSVFNNDKYALAVISSILSGEYGRLYARIRGKLGLSYTQGSFSVPGVDPGYYIFYVGTSSKNIELVKKELLNQIKLLVSRPVTDEELRLSKKELLGQHVISTQTNSALAFHTALDELYGVGYGHYLEFKNNIESLKKDDIQKAASKYFSPEIYTMVIIDGRK